MYSFKLRNGKILDSVDVDGYLIAGLILEGIYISIKINAHKKIIAEIKPSDIIILKGIDYQPYLVEAVKIAEEYIYSRELDYFCHPHSDNVIDIVNSKNKSFYHTNLPFIKETFHLKMQLLCSEAILENMNIKT